MQPTIVLGSMAMKRKPSLFLLGKRMCHFRVQIPSKILHIWMMIRISIYIPQLHTEL